MTKQSNESIDIEKEIKKIELFASRMKKLILDMALKAGANGSHLGGGLSMAEITATLFGSVMKHDHKDPLWPERDRFILSKGHGVLGY